MIRLFARWRVPLGFVFGAIVLWVAEPTWATLFAGGVLAAIGEIIRIWAAGHVEKSREVTRSGPYRWMRHPLYLGSTIIAAGVAVAANSRVVGALVAIYVVTTIPAAIVSEESHLRDKFGADYDAYKARQGAPMVRRFSAARARHNREHHTVAGVLIGFALLALKAQLWLR